MNKLTKLLSVFIIAGAVGASVAGVSGCKKDKGHSHSVDLTKSVDNGDGTHDVYCSCGHLMFGDDPHSFGPDGKCTKCDALETDHVHHYTWHDNEDGTHNGTCSEAGCDHPSITNEVHDLGPDGKCKKCGGSAVNPEVKSITVKSAGDVTSIKLNAKLQFSAEVTAVGGAATTVTWSVENGTGTATISDSGLLTATGVGTVTVKATSTVTTSVSDEFALTIADLSDYERLMARNDKLAVIDNIVTEGNKLKEVEDYSTKGIFARAQAGTAVAHDPAVEYVEVADESGVRTLVQHGSGGTTDCPNVFTDIVIGPATGIIEGYFETKVVYDKFGSSQDFISFNDGVNSLFKITLTSSTGDKNATGTIKYKVGTTESDCDATATVTIKEYASVYFKLDKDAGKVTVKIGDTVVLNEKAIDISALNCIELPSTNKGQRLHTTKNIVVCGAGLTLDEYKTSSKASLKAAYDKYPIATEYTTNGAHVTKAYEDGVKAIEAAADMDGVSDAHAAAVAAMKAILKDAEIPAARSAAKTALENKFPYANYNIALDASLPNSKYNNKAQHAEEMKAYEDAILAATLQSELDEIVKNANITVGTDAEQRAEMKAEAIANLKAHLTSKATEIAALNESDKLRIDAIIKVDGETVTGSGITAINGADTIQNAQAAYDEAVADIDRIIENANKGIEEIIAAYEKDLDDFVPSRAYSDTDKIDLDGEQTVAQLIAAAKTAGKTEIAKAKDITTVEGVDNPTAAQILDAQKKFALAEFDKAKAAINLIACKNFRLNNTNEAEVDGIGVREYVKRAKEKVKEADVLALFDALSEDEIKAATTIDEVVLKTRAYKFAVDIILEKNDACYGEGETDKPSTYGLEKYFNVQFTASGLREEDKEALHTKIYTHYQTIYSIAADGTEEAVVAKITKAAADGRAAIDSEISALKNAVFTVTVKFNGYTDEATKTVNVRYGDTLTKESIYITGMTVTNLYGEDGNEITEGVKVYADTTVKVSVSDVNPAAASATYTPVGPASETDKSPTPITDNKVLDDTLLTVTVPDGCNIYHKGYQWKDSNNKDKTFGQVAIKNESGTEVKFDDALTLGNITGNTDNSEKPLTIYAKSALSSLKVYLKLAGSNGTDGRTGNVYYKINGGTAVERAGIDKVLVISDIKAGDVVQIYIKNTSGSGGHMWVTKVEAAADLSKTPKLVTVQWQNEDGSVWKTTTHSYLETITAPEGSPEVTSGAFTGWKLGEEALTEAGVQLASSSTAYVMRPVTAMADITVHFTDGTIEFNDEFLSSATTNTLPEAQNASETNMFLGWYLQTGEAPADTDTVFDINTAAAGEYNVYAKYLASTITVTYTVGTVETVENLFILNDSVVKVDKSAAALPADPESTDPENPEFKGWFYTPAGGEETQFTAEVLAGLTAGNYTVTAKFGAATQPKLLQTISSFSNPTSSIVLTGDAKGYIEGDAIAASKSSSGASANSNGELKMESSTKLNLTTVKACTLKITLAAGSALNLDGVAVNATDGVVTLNLEAGQTYEITRKTGTTTISKIEIYSAV